MYWDANNLYGWAMSQYLPIGEYAWLEHDNAQWQRALFNSDGYGSEAVLTSIFTPAYISAIGHESKTGYTAAAAAKARAATAPAAAAAKAAAQRAQARAAAAVKARARRARNHAALLLVVARDLRARGAGAAAAAAAGSRCK